MATANITWTNNSTTDSPTGTKVERSEDLAFNHSSATATEVANGNGGGLDPTAANGSYADGTVSAYKHYSYRVSTLKNSETATGVATPLEYVYDQTNELGYPNGSPSSAPTYNCSVEPDIHYDASRLGGYAYNTLQGLNALNGSYADRYYVETDGSLSGALRHNKIGATMMYSGGVSNRPVIGYVEVNGNNQKFLGRLQGTTLTGGPGNSSSVKILNDSTNVIHNDGVTIFSVGCQGAYGTAFTGANGFLSDSSGGDYLLGSNMGGNVVVDGIAAYKGASAAPGGNTNSIASGATVAWPAPFGVNCYRHNNTLTAFNSAGGTGAQVFQNGSETFNTGDNNSMSYHQSGTPAYPTHLGAYILKGGGAIGLGNPNWSDCGVFEYLVFPGILDANDMNAVTGYLCNRYGQSFNSVASGDLI
tara:strand:+ start:615 stop:1868 length:1254 start_codon:yes stop_codon:yes gene_type:complete